MGKGAGKSAGDPSVNGVVEVSSGAFYGSVFASTAKLSQGADAEVIRTLVATNWVRTLAWTGRAVLAGWMLRGLARG